MRQRLEEALRHTGADYAEIRIERAEGTSISFRGSELDSISSASSLGGVARALVRGGWGIVTFNGISELRSKLAEAVACARLVGSEKSQLAEVEPVARTVPPPHMERDFREVPLSEKKQNAQSYNDIMLKWHPKIKTTTVSYRDVYREVHFANSEGSYFEETRPDVVLYLVAVARDGNLVQRATESAGKAAGFEITLGREAKAEAAATRRWICSRRRRCRGAFTL